MMKRHLIISVLGAALLSLPGQAAWYEATGQAFISQGDVEQARQQAIDDAVKRAALAAGASVRSTQVVLNGVLQQEQLGVSSQGEIKQLQLITEQQQDDLITVTLRLDIEAQGSSCEGNIYRKPLLLSQVQLHARQDAIYGQLFELGADVTNQLKLHMQDYSPAALVKPMQQSVTAQQLVYPDTDRMFRQGNQYILLAQINDLSLGQSTNRFWQQSQKERFFSLQVNLYDLFEQHLVFQQEYRTSASWPYESKSTPASHSQAFWQMPYGQKIDHLLSAVAEDVQRQLQCEPLLSSIRQVKDNQVMLEIGKIHGLQPGDELQLFQLQRHPTSPGIKRLIKEAVSLKVTDLSEQHAWASGSTKLLKHIQQGDIVSVRKIASY
ncbi:flagellar assembly protein FlgT [Rheinheimera aquimaris]|uniref:Flagellar assembly protein FlgT n=1 Tax=Rheinheimera aquimaris TaxID=412437 RepID=A0ABP3NAH9_9GAMM|nr:flagellar assembly protein T N-terminal domain-containing protein [Rheinheimera aquimaris]MCB5212690.1 flagellar assembly protein FlgT [Rheinheimera aquimaris]